MNTRSEDRCPGALLVVEDDPGVAQSLSWALESAGRRCYVVESVDQAVETLGSQPDVVDVLLDRGVLGGEIVDAVARLRKAAPQATLIGTSGRDCRDEFRSAGISIFLEKPWSVMNLLERRGRDAADASQP